MFAPAPAPCVVSSGRKPQSSHALPKPSFGQFAGFFAYARSSAGVFAVDGFGQMAKLTPMLSTLVPPWLLVPVTVIVADGSSSVLSVAASKRSVTVAGPVPDAGVT